MLTDSEVDRRFLKLIAHLNSAVRTVDWRSVSEPAAPYPRRDVKVDSRPAIGIGALRVLAVAVALVMFVSGVVLARTFGFGFFGIVAWFALVVPGVTLAALLLVDLMPHGR